MGSAAPSRRDPIARSAVEDTFVRSYTPRSPAEPVGCTPLLALHRLGAGLPGQIALKLESRNPSSSVKDRVAHAIVADAEATGALQPGGTIVAASSGNTGIALARLGAARGYKVRVTLPRDWSHERLALLLYLGADVILTPGGGMKAAVERASEVAAATRGSVLVDQFASSANPAVHRRTTAEEIWADSGGRVAAFVAGVGTGGTITGVALGLRAHDPGVRIVAVEPKECAVLSGGHAGSHGIQGIGPGFVPPLFRFDLVDRIVAVGQDDAFAWARRLASDEGILAGASSGATVCAALALAAEERMRDKLIVAMVGDSAERYVMSPRIDAPAARRRQR
jgi:cysteine synthase A